MPGVYENDAQHEPEADASWFQFFFIPNQPTAATLGNQGSDEHTGIVQINLNFPINEGSGTALEKADELRILFKAGSKHTYQGQTVTAISCGQNGAGQIVNGFYQTILTIQYRAQSAR